MGVLWIRLDTQMIHIGWASELPGHQFAAWVKLLALVKEAGRRGRIKQGYFTDAELKKIKVPRSQWNAMLVAAQNNNAIEVKESDIVVVSWASYQIDRTHAERQADYRARKAGVTVRDGCDGKQTYIQDTTDNPPTPLRGSEAAGGDESHALSPSETIIKALADVGVMVGNVRGISSQVEAALRIPGVTLEHVLEVIEREKGRFTRWNYIEAILNREAAEGAGPKRETEVERAKRIATEKWGIPK